jgi:hypothetical protein
VSTEFAAQPILQNTTAVDVVDVVGIQSVDKARCWPPLSIAEPDTSPMAPNARDP